MNDPRNIFSGRASGSIDPRQHVQQLAGPGVAYTEHVGVAPGSNDGTLITDDPTMKVAAVVRPNRNWGGAPAGTQVVVTRAELEQEAATLCSPAEYAAITRRQATPAHQALQRQIQEMRAAQTDASRRALTPEQRAELERLQAQARADDDREVRLRQEMALAAQETRPSAAPVAPLRVPATEQELEDRIQKIRTGYVHATAHVGSKGAQALRDAEAQEIAELRAAFEQERAKAPKPDLREWAEAPAGSIEDRLGKLAALHRQGLINDAAYEKRQAEILAEV